MIQKIDAGHYCPCAFAPPLVLCPMRAGRDARRAERAAARALRRGGPRRRSRRPVDLLGEITIRFASTLPPRLYGRRLFYAARTYRQGTHAWPDRNDPNRVAVAPTAEDLPTFCQCRHIYTARLWGLLVCGSYNALSTVPPVSGSLSCPRADRSTTMSVALSPHTPTKPPPDDP